MIARPKDGPGGRLTRVADNRVRIASDPIGGWGALNFLQLNADRHTGQAWDTFNPHPSEAAPQLTLGRNGLAFRATPPDPSHLQGCCAIRVHGSST